jgi:hypothetical protein
MSVSRISPCLPDTVLGFWHFVDDKKSPPMPKVWAEKFLLSVCGEFALPVGSTARALEIF